MTIEEQNDLDPMRREHARVRGDLMRLCWWLTHPGQLLTEEDRSEMFELGRECMNHVRGNRRRNELFDWNDWRLVLAGTLRAALAMLGEEP